MAELTEIADQIVIIMRNLSRTAAITVTRYFTGAAAVAGNFSGIRDTSPEIITDRASLMVRQMRLHRRPPNT